jgi:hypothetical protein
MRFAKLGAFRVPKRPELSISEVNSANQLALGQVEIV